MTKLRSFVTGPFGKGAIGAIVAVGLLMGALHLYQDHVALHQMIGFVNAYAPRVMAIPAPGTPPPSASPLKQP